MVGSPRIAVNGDISGVPRKRWSIPVDYLDAISDLGGIPVPVPPTAHASALLNEVDGILFIGGDDYQRGNPPGQTPNGYTAVDPRREESDFALARHALQHDLPVLGICCGFQLLVLAAGGTIHGDLPTEFPSNVVHKGPPQQGSAAATSVSPLVYHDVQWLEQWGGISPQSKLRINSHHHQAAALLPASWRPLAVAPDGVIEAACGPGRYQLGIQWHPEKETDDPLNAQLFRSLIEACSA